MSGTKFIPYTVHVLYVKYGKYAQYTVLYRTYKHQIAHRSSSRSQSKSLTNPRLMQKGLKILHYGVNQCLPCMIIQTEWLCLRRCRIIHYNCAMCNYLVVRDHEACSTLYIRVLSISDSNPLYIAINLSMVYHGLLQKSIGPWQS